LGAKQRPGFGDLRKLRRQSFYAFDRLPEHLIYGSKHVAAVCRRLRLQLVSEECPVDAD